MNKKLLVLALAILAVSSYPTVYGWMKGLPFYPDIVYAMVFGAIGWVAGILFLISAITENEGIIT